MMHNGNVRTTVTLDDETHDFAAYYARVRGLTLGAAIDELIRKAQAAPATAPGAVEYSANGLPLLPRIGRVITSEMVKELSEDEIG